MTVCIFFRPLESQQIPQKIYCNHLRRKWMIFLNQVIIIKKRRRALKCVSSWYNSNYIDLIWLIKTMRHHCIPFVAAEHMLKEQQEKCNDTKERFESLLKYYTGAPASDQVHQSYICCSKLAIVQFKFT